MSKTKDITGYKFGRLTVIEKTEDYVSPAGKRASKWKCRCECGNIIDVLANNLKKGNSTQCNICARKVPSNAKDLIGKKFERLTVVEKINYVDSNNIKHIKWKCVCDCGNITYCTTTDLLSGHSKSCGCYCKDKNSMLNLENLTGRKFGTLTVIERADDHIQPNGRHNRMWRCLCDCGNEVIVRASCLKNGNTKSCGCMKSVGEKEISALLQSLNVKFKREISIDGCVSTKKYPLIFDFAIYDELNNIKCLIEFQGAQHYIIPRNSEWFGKLQRDETDKIKRKFCKQNNIMLFEIKYCDDIKFEVNKILNAIHVNTVPSAQCAKV